MPESRSKQLQPGFKLFPEKWDSESILGEAAASILLGSLTLMLICAEHIIIHYRFVFVLLLLPASFLYDLWFFIRLKYNLIYVNPES